MIGGGAGQTRLLSSALGDELTADFEICFPVRCLHFAHDTKLRITFNCEQLHIWKTYNFIQGI